MAPAETREALAFRPGSLHPPIWDATGRELHATVGFADGARADLRGAEPSVARMLRGVVSPDAAAAAVAKVLVAPGATDVPP